MKGKSLQKNISEIKGVGPKVKEELNKIGINHIQDALFLLPKKYENRTKLTSIKDLTPGEAFQFTQSYQGPGMTNQTLIQRTTQIKSVTDTTSTFTQ